MSDEKNKDKKSEDDGKKVISKIIYIGGDTTFFKNLERRFEELSDVSGTVFEQYDSDEDEVIQSFLLKLRDENPKLVLIDYSKNDAATLHLTRCWLRQNFHLKIPFIGLCEYKQSKSLVVKAIMTTLECIHVKSSEFESICYDIDVLAFPEKVKDHGFATAKMNDAVKAYYPAKANFLNQNFLMIESNYSMQEKQQLRVNNFWSRKQLVKSNLVMCASQTQENIYYNYKYSQALQFAHVDPVVQTADMTNQDGDKKQAERTSAIEVSKISLGKWLRENAYNSRPKFLKAFVVDKEMTFFDNEILTDSYSFVYRAQPFIKNCKKEITNIRPQLIIYNMEVVSKEELEADEEMAYTYNDSRMFQHLLKVVKEVCQGYQPIIIVFNSGEYDSAYMQKVFNYESILAVKEKINLDLCIKMSEMLKAKIQPNLPAPREGDIYIDKSADISYCEVESDITIVACSENDMYLNSVEQLAIGTILRITMPVPMYITVSNAPAAPKADSQYYAIIHGIGEEERQELRRYINSIFFRDLQNNKAKDAEEVNATKEKYIETKEAERLAAIEAAEEEAAAEQAEKASKESKKEPEELGETKE